jgi:hypothetical protein
VPIEPQTAALFAKFAARFGQPIFGLAGRAATRLAESLTLNLAPYYETTIARCSNIRTLISRDQSIPMDSIYVPTYLSVGEKTTNEDDFIEAIPRVRSIIICGSGGCGKSIFTRHLFLSLANGATAALPILVELRGMNALATAKILPYVYHTVVLGPGAVITERQFESAVKEGAIYLILDGFDDLVNKSIPFRGACLGAAPCAKIPCAKHYSGQGPMRKIFIPLMEASNV